MFSGSWIGRNLDETRFDNESLKFENILQVQQIQNKGPEKNVFKITLCKHKFVSVELPFYPEETGKIKFYFFVR